MKLECVAEALGGELVGSREVSGLANLGYRLDVKVGSDVKRFAVKVYCGRRARVKAEKELKLYRLMPQYGLKAPTVVLVDLEGELVGRPLLAWEWIRGVPADRVLERRSSMIAAARVLGAALAKLHSIPLGELDPGLFKYGESFWREEASTIRMLARLAGVPIAPLVRRVEELECEQYALIHGDYSPGNVLMSGEGPYIIDLEDARVGDPLYDVAYAYVFMSAGGRWELAKAFALEYFRISGISVGCLASRLVAAALKLYLLLGLRQFVSVFKRKVGLFFYPLFELLFLKPFKRHLRSMVMGGFMSLECWPE